MRPKNLLKTTVYGLIFTLLIVIFIGNAFEEPQKLETSLIGSYGYDSSALGLPGQTVKIKFNLHASGNQVGGIKNEQTQFYVSILNEGTAPVTLYSANFHLSIPNLQLIAPSQNNSTLIALYQTFPGAEAADYSEFPSATETINYFGASPSGRTIAPNQELFLVSFAGMYPESGIYNFSFIDGKLFLEPPVASTIPVIDFANKDIAFNFPVRENDADLVLHPSQTNLNFSEFGQVNQNEIQAVLENWSE
jgi:hypothetical protein